MPIIVDAEINSISQDEFSKVSYCVMREVFQLHRELGRLFDEEVYRRALLAWLTDAQEEVLIDVSFKDFHKSYYMDMLVGNGAVFELKAVRHLNSCHRGQLLNYLLLVGLDHGKLINFRNSQLEHEFVNSSASSIDRMSFTVDNSEWHATQGFGNAEVLLVQELVRDWGTGLSRSLYDKACVYLLCGDEEAHSQINVYVDGCVIAKQDAVLCSKNVVLKVTSLDHGIKVYHTDLKRLLKRTDINAIQWVNIARNTLMFITIT